MTRDELVDKLVELYTSTEIPVTAAGGVFAFMYGDQVVDVYSPAELMNAAAEKDTRIKPRYQAELGSAFNMYRYFKSHPATQSEKQALQNIEGSRQRIVYGAPGTGKSFGIAGKVPDENVFRTTFHPDSDYSTFVGAYKPTMEGDKIVYKFRPQAFMDAYVAAWKEEAKGSGGVERTDKVKKPYSGLNAVMVNVVNAFIAEGGKGVEKSRKEIIDKAIELSGGEYSEQSFVPSDYCYNRVNGLMTLTRPALFEHLENGKYKCLGPDDATYDGDILWLEKGSGVEKIVGKCTAGERKLFAGDPGKPVVLVVEEINRGNCAQIFGDLFQLLDRGDDGYSTYPIDADTDLAAWLAEDEQFGDGIEGVACPECIKEGDWKAILKGRKLALPPKMYIWATMNTSDQSLFPIDSAFKRRWDWQYVPISKPDTANGFKDRKIIANGNAYDWWDFISIINEQIADVTKSEDKQLGYFFVKAPDATGHITAERFANKVIFYLFNDVFKDWDLPEKIFGKGSGKNKYAFKDFFYSETTVVGGKTFKPGTVKEEVVAEFIEKQKDAAGKTVGKESLNPPTPPSVASGAAPVA